MLVQSNAGILYLEPGCIGWKRACKNKPLEANPSCARNERPGALTHLKGDMEAVVEAKQRVIIETVQNLDLFLPGSLPFNSNHGVELLVHRHRSIAGPPLICFRWSIKGIRGEEGSGKTTKVSISRPHNVVSAPFLGLKITFLHAHCCNKFLNRQRIVVWIKPRLSPAARHAPPPRALH